MKKKEKEELREITSELKLILQDTLKILSLAPEVVRPAKNEPQQASKPTAPLKTQEAAVC
jgi:hypothetical protein